MTTTSAPRGRPRAVSRQMLQEAAFELFLLQGYAGTTVDQIASCAGVSRATFFNYFDAKSDVFWVDLDESLAVILPALRDGRPGEPPTVALRRALLAVAQRFGPDRVPWALTYRDLVGGADDLQASAVSRLKGAVQVLADELEARHPGASALARAAAAAAVGAAVAAMITWTEAGTSRGDLTPYLDGALTPLCAGYQAAFDALP